MRVSGRTGSSQLMKGKGFLYFMSKLVLVFSYSRRKRGEKGEVVETVEDVIVRKLTAERVEELKKIIKETQEKYRYVAEELNCSAPKSPVLEKLTKWDGAWDENAA